MIEIRETTWEDIRDLRSLWADGSVMHFVGFPDGLHRSEEEMKPWFQRLVSGRPRMNHYSVFADGVYCGETFYKIEEEHGRYAVLDIKLFPFARGRGIAAHALSYAIREAFRHGAEAVWVDPHPDNVKARALYERLGFAEAERPEFLLEGGEAPSTIYMELKRSHGGEAEGSL